MDGRLHIRGERVETPEKLVSENPATREPLGQVSVASEDLCGQAIQAAKDAFVAWRWLPPRDKGNILKRAERILAGRAEEIARLIAREKGSPYPESLAVEVFGALQSLSYYAANQGRLLRPERDGHFTPLFFNKSAAYHFHPLGPTLIISPWNFPFLIPMFDVMSALTAGNTVVLRPSTTTPFAALAIGEIFSEAGLPPGVLNVVVCRAPQAEAMILDPRVQTVMFTGSGGVGRRVMELCSRNLTKLALELGGKDPMIVLEDADLERAARGAVWAAFMNCGQSCGSVERVYVAKGIADAFTSRVVELARQVKVGDPLVEGVDMGPMATAGQLKVVEEHIADARAKGAVIAAGGGRVAGPAGYFIEPTVLTGVDHTMRCMTEETFGPTLPIMPFDGDDQAVALANDSVYGLTASVWTRDRKRAAWFAERLEAGSVTVNDHMYSFVEPRAIWGGIKQTGMGRCHGPYGLHELVDIKYVGTDFFRKKAQTWWFPYDRSLSGIMEKAITLFHTGSRRAKLKAALGLRKDWARIMKTAPLFNYVRGLPRMLRK
jgi:acyl-CoA reductase-like NAD-dependent aldehyde dehydrogenase